MNILLSHLPKKLQVDGVFYRIRSDFKTGLRTILAFEDPNLIPSEKYNVMLANIYLDLPSNIDSACREAVIFLNGGEETSASDEGNKPARLYSFNKDAKFIFSAFRQTHGIDLTTSNLHWWTFMALFMDLGNETTFTQIINFRKRLRSGKASKEERALAREMQDVLSLEVNDQTIEERILEREFWKAFNGEPNGNDNA